MALSKKYPVIRLALLASLLLFDAVATYWLLSKIDNPATFELNPLMGLLIRAGWVYFFAFKIIATILLIAGFVYIYGKKRTKHSGWVLNGGLAAIAIVTINNIIGLVITS